MSKLLIPYNLQFFAEEGDNSDSTDTSGDNGGSDSSGSDTETKVDAEAFADLISEKDKKIESLEKDIASLKKSNAEMLVRMNAANHQESKDLGETIVDFCDTRKVK